MVLRIEASSAASHAALSCGRLFVALYQRSGLPESCMSNGKVL
jgi:hypothetical protein